jgi:FtsP/CotA-like multicopper oxidase with cupredoxin domain
MVALREKGKPTMLDRRKFLTGGATALAVVGLPSSRLPAVDVREYRIVAAPGRTSLLGKSNPESDVWAYSGQVPGPEIRIRQGERLRLAVENQLPESTTVHCHGIRMPNAMDGVPHLTQEPIEPGRSFSYEFVCPDAGTFWYHPHINSAAQVGRGLYGPLIVEEHDPPSVNREVVWVLDDWRLTKDGAIHQEFRNLHDITHAGRIGNTITINGSVTDSFAVRAGEHIRLRLINAANARVFALDFEEHKPIVIAIDGQPVEPHAAPEGKILLGPAMRVDVIVDCVGKPGRRYTVRDGFYPRMNYTLVELAYSLEPALEEHREALRSLPANPLAEPNLSAAKRHQVVLGGGMMGRMMSAVVDGQELDIRSMFQRGVAWSMNGVATIDHVHAPMFTFERNRSYVLEIVNDTAWPHPMHLHGHSFRVISRNGKAERYRPWQDTVLLLGREWVEIALVADNPGDWMFHCHVLEHQIAGMMATIRVN